MKKLIEELEAKYTQLYRNGHDGELLDGFDEALQIVKSHDPWIDASELPPRDEIEPDFSIDVMITDGKSYRLGYYSHGTNSWVMHKHMKGGVTHWTYLLELP